MRLIVCVKQVPEVEDIEFDPITKTLVREGVRNVVNPFDRRALAEAIRLRDLCGGEVVVMTMGPPQARDALIECLAAGADRALHLLDKAFAGADTLATARTLALALKNEPFDIIFCGKYSVDAETGQVGPELAEFLDIPQVTGATRLELSEDKKRVVVERETDEGFEMIECELPVLLTAGERLVRPIKVKGDQIELGRAKPITVVTASDLMSDHSIFGLAGSPTTVTEIRSLARARQVEFVESETPDEKAMLLIEKLRARGAFETSGFETNNFNTNDKDSERGQAPLAPARKVAGRELWVVAEVIGEEVRRVSFELLGKGIELAGKLGATLAAFVAGTDAGRHAKTLAAYGAEKVYFAEDDSLRDYSTSAYASLLTRATQTYHPIVVLIPSTPNGRDLAPRVAARLAIGLTADCIDLDVNARGELVQYKPAFGGNIVALIVSRTLPQMATVRPGMLKAARPDHERSATVTCLPFAPLERQAGARLISARRDVSVEVSDLEEAHSIVCAGTGVGGPENIPILQALAEALGGVLGATRRVVDAGWLPRQQQIGLTGKIVSPRLYIGAGVRGAFNHTIGIQQAGTIVAINTDPNADIFQTADLGIVDDFARIVPAITAKLRA